jgi:phospholipid/cholesterol/gamma-HCH transport system ATP-binding protein
MDQPPVLEFAAAVLMDGVSIDLTLGAGDLILIDPGDEEHERTVADAACGLAAPLHGTVSMLGRDWLRQQPDHANALRGRIGHSFRRGSWVPYLSLIDNILLPQLHHTTRPYSEIRDEANRLSAGFGLPGLPTVLPGQATASDLARADLIRAFTGSPTLVILEGPPADGIGPLVSAIRTARDRDGAVLWFTLDPALWYEPAIPATRRYRLRGDALMVEGDTR